MKYYTIKMYDYCTMQMKHIWISNHYKSIACSLANPFTPEDKGSHMTAMVCFSVSGDAIKPMIILPGIKNIPQNLSEYDCFWNKNKKNKMA